MLEIRKITKKYKTGDFTQKALNGVSVNFRECEFVSILGPSGSGKTTLLNIIGGLDRYIDNYEEWLVKLEKDKTDPGNNRVPALTYFLVRENDNKIIGMINIRLVLNEKLRKSGGHIGYGIRPTERKKGYNKINLYLGLQVCQKYGLDKVLLDADLDNPASWRTMEALGGVRIREYCDSEMYDSTIVDYNIDVKKSLDTYKDIYEPYISKNARNKIFK